MNYFDHKAVSNSNLSLINPEQGGSPKKYKAYVEDKIAKDDETPSLKNGKIIHKYLENKDSFITSDITLPSEMMCGWVEDFYKSTRGMGELSPTTYEEMILGCRGDRYSNMKDPIKLLEKFEKEGNDYLSFLTAAEDKIIMDKATKTVVESVISSLNNDKEAYELLYTLEIGDEVFSELDIKWVYLTEIMPLDCKSLLDKVKINPVTKTVTLIDGKTTSKPISLFAESFRKYRYYRQMAFYRQALYYYLKENYPLIEEWSFKTAIVVMETIGLFEVQVFWVQDEWIGEGYLEIERLMKRVVEHKSTENWDKQLEYSNQTILQYDK